MKARVSITRIARLTHKSAVSIRFGDLLGVSGQGVYSDFCMTVSPVV